MWTWPVTSDFCLTEDQMKVLYSTCFKVYGLVVKETDCEVLSKSSEYLGVKIKHFWPHICIYNTLWGSSVFFFSLLKRLKKKAASISVTFVAVVCVGLQLCSHEWEKAEWDHRSVELHWLPFLKNWLIIHSVALSLWNGSWKRNFAWWSLNLRWYRLTDWLLLHGLFAPTDGKEHYIKFAYVVTFSNHSCMLLPSMYVTLGNWPACNIDFDLWPGKPVHLAFGILLQCLCILQILQWTFPPLTG